MRHFQLDPDRSPPATLRAFADAIHDVGKVLDSPCQPLELQDQRDIGQVLKYLAGWLHGFAVSEKMK
jgi:hypothetical protein